MKNGSIRKKLIQFRSYYLVPTIAIVLAIIAAVLVLTRIFGKREETLLYVAVFDNVMDGTAKVETENQLLSEFISSSGTDVKSAEKTSEEEINVNNGLQVVTIDDSFRTTNGKDAERLLVLSANHAVDVLVGSRDVIAAFAGYGYLYDLEELLPSDENLEERMILLPGYLEDGSNSFEDTETGRGEEKRYGISLSGSSLMENLGCDTEGMYAGIVLECAQRDHAVRFLEDALGNID